MSNQDLPQRVLEHVKREQYQSVKPRIIAKQLGLKPEELPHLKKVIKRLVKNGDLKYGPKHLVLKPTVEKKKTKKRDPDSPGNPPDKRHRNKAAGQGKKAGRKDELTGRFSRAAGGFGFVIVTPDPNAGPDTKPIDDIYVPQRHTLDAASGDIVRVRISTRKQGPRNKTSGRIVEIIDRRTHQFVGTYLEKGKHGLVSIDGKQFDSDVLVGDAGAKACKVGDKVVVEMVRFPGPNKKGDWQTGEAVIVKVLGDRGQPGIDTMTVIAEFGLPGEFAEAVMEDARQQAEDFDESIGDRTDFTKDTVVTIDPKTARDFDDAISLKKIENGHWELGVHIADVSHFVKPNTELDNEAYRRATSIYLPDQVIPMLPEVISNNLASLQPDRIRYCMTAVIEFTDEGVPIGTTLHRGAIKSCHRFNYEEIDEYLEDDKPWKKKLTPQVFDLVRNMHTLAMKLRKRRMNRGSFDLAIPEVEILLDEDGRVSGAATRQHTESHQVIEEFMLAANEAVAQHLFDQGLYLMRRVHENPAPSKLTDLKSMISDLGYKANNLASRFELKRVIEESRDTPESHAVHFAILRAMPKAIYSPRELGHYALASEAYCHFTSPIRRYPDLIIHRMVGALVDGQKPSADFGTLTALGHHCSDLEQRAEKAERELKKLKLINFLADKIGDEMDAVISGVESFGMFAQGIELPASGFIPVDTLPKDKYHFEKSTRTLTGFKFGNQYRMGDMVRIRIVSADPDRREIEYALVVDKSGSGKPAAKKKKSGSKQDDRKNQDKKRRTKKHDTKQDVRKSQTAPSKGKSVWPENPPGAKAENPGKAKKGKRMKSQPEDVSSNENGGDEKDSKSPRKHK